MRYVTFDSEIFYLARFRKSGIARTGPILPLGHPMSHLPSVVLTSGHHRIEMRPVGPAIVEQNGKAYAERGEYDQGSQQVAEPQPRPFHVVALA
jgi:hypothetical protein